jgi:paraquat-inducible protein B
MLRKLISQGLRAELSSNPPVVGGKMIVLRFVPNAPPATLGDGPMPVIPSTSAAGIEGIISQVSDVAGKIDAMPLPQIAADIHRTADRLAALSQSPELTDGLHHLDQSLANIDAVSADTRRRIGPILTQLRRTADQAEATLASARAVLGTGQGGETQPATAGVPATLYQLSRAARSLRELADYLDRHPEALLKGKGTNE